MAKFNVTPPDDPYLYEVLQNEPRKTSFWHRLKLCYRLIWGFPVIFGAKLAVHDSKLWVVQRKDARPTAISSSMIYNTDTFQDRLMISGPHWVEMEKQHDA